MTEKQEILASMQKALGVREVNYLEDDSIEFNYKGYSVNILLKKMKIFREKPRVKDELHKMKMMGKNNPVRLS